MPARGLGFGAFRLAIELLPGYQQQIADQVRAATGLRLEFDSLNARIGRYGPEIFFNGARVLPASGDEPLVTAAAGPREPRDRPFDLVPADRGRARLLRRGRACIS